MYLQVVKAMVLVQMLSGLNKRTLISSANSLRTYSSKSIIPLRDHYESLNAKNLKSNLNFYSYDPKKVKYDSNFFTNQYGNENLHLFENLNSFNPTLINAIARYFIINYKLNYYPYYDLNLINVYTDLEQSLHLITNLIEFYRRILSPDMFTKIKIYLLPLHQYDKGNIKTLETLLRIKKTLPKNIVVLDGLPIFADNKDGDAINPAIQELIIENDPIYILLFNDIIKYLAHDTVTYSKSEGKWKQLYVDVDSLKTKDEKIFFEGEVDYWCEQAIQYYFAGNVKNATPNQIYNIPTRLIQLFKLINRNFPEHKFFAIDNPVRIKKSFLEIVRDFIIPFGKQHTAYNGSRLFVNNEKTISYNNNFQVLQRIYNKINEPTQFITVEELSVFIDQYSNVKEDGQNYKELEKIITFMRCSTLATLYSSQI
ncbi:hypothetical protein TPHA_0C00200 [Tetrapisispora phaffii CBS 4417]|uniref:type II protein arginine methyltransferase n=1 Tax=Tetrapisispora phaffii (strain ATCC 24235 / CBS 4417 / NBRC 1672 / NRRL Y-8282 / UCD 70-5) TaxID=1071381 RepID=G8BR01_TETPH|nr:hypothetical protein TPHA_0C00200 [Tetrapisispora phaffii CBS 4417]CCE62177.1 hypothetical protein TPHA_0C00200 [Tetrapisispora phaffii CBS 4417]